MKEGLEVREMVFNRNMLRIPWTAHLSNEEGLRQVETKGRVKVKRLREFDTHSTNRKDCGKHRVTELMVMISKEWQKGKIYSEIQKVNVYAKT